ncbi:MAG TPA: bifunctional [glutamate--ammonia ligase]-adenylyl-L-tyrosine phosphorylase/[glutamate--ammonia-ligase] adenylyltransferase [Candidatus Binataceae bacterium]|nr:bifunctional [glutamate--ammonia ligase]-adenylyl-L-tyrosine phosphorylase/[glutamate--ammonia-ligase] adenylyltransferase [Candidatus Binataceae bacterium]
MPETVVLAPELHDLAAQLARRLGDPRLAATATAVVAHRAPDERLALATLLKLVEESPAELRAALADETLAGDLALCVGGSEVVAQGLGTMGPGWLGFLRAACGATAESIDGAIRFDAGLSADRQEAARRLGEFKLRLFLQIAIADLTGRLDVAATMRAMSLLADQCIATALDCARLIVGRKAPAAAEFCVIGMGKLGAQELNLSSDIDLIYVFDGPDDDAEAVARLGETLTELLSAKCFRVDMRLRPGGRNAPLVTPLEGALSFYQNFGETWERAALLRARPVAGVLEIGRRLIGELGHFVYRRYLDFDTLRQLRAMKYQIERELRAPDLVDRNIKLGYGGIRELEFIVQALILVYGGRDPRLRTARTLAALERLGALGYLNPGRASELAAAYLFLRDVEHKLQIVAALQTHVLPANEADRRALAARMGRGKDSAARARFETELLNHRALIAAQFREMLGAAEDRGGRAASEAAERAWRAALEPRQSAPMLQALGFARPEESTGHLMLLAGGPEHAIAAAAPRRRELLERLGPLLLDEIRELADPDLALMNLASFIAAIGARSSFLELLEQHPSTRRVVLSLFASSAHLSTIFIRHPDMIDTLVRSDLAHPRRSPTELDEELRALVAASPDVESRLDAIRAFRHQEFLRIAIADLAGDLDADAVQAELGLLAEVVLRRALELARDEVAARTPIPPAAELVALAMGRLGAAEMSYNSDLDLIFVYQDRGEAAEGSRVAASKIVQKLIAVLEARTREGYAYKIDLRLRPSGNAGPLVASLDGFRDYHRTNSSAVWERQALVRARVIAGDPKLGAEVEAARREFVFGRGLSRAEVGEVAAMRLRIERELGADGRGRLNIKQGRGGLVDVEFLTQMMALRYGHAHPELTGRATVALVRGIGQCGLLEQGAAAQLEADYRFLSRLENRMRIETDQAAWALSTEPESLGHLARRMGYREAGGAGRLLQELEACRTRIRATFNECFRIEMSRDG